MWDVVMCLEPAFELQTRAGTLKNMREEIRRYARLKMKRLKWMPAGVFRAAGGRRGGGRVVTDTIELDLDQDRIFIASTDYTSCI